MGEGRAVGAHVVLGSFILVQARLSGHLDGWRLAWRPETLLLSIERKRNVILFLGDWRGTKRNSFHFLLNIRLHLELQRIGWLRHVKFFNHFLFSGAQCLKRFNLCHLKLPLVHLSDPAGLCLSTLSRSVVIIQLIVIAEDLVLLIRPHTRRLGLFLKSLVNERICPLELSILLPGL